jgi:outer membrane protein assembly factor BamA
LCNSLLARGSDSLFIKDIRITGNHKTKSWVISREILFNPNSWVRVIDTSRLATQSRFQLNKTALFNSVNVYEEVNGDTMSVQVNLVERWYIIPSVSFSIADRNFNAWLEDPTLYRTTYGGGIDFNNLRGRNEKLSITFTLGWRKALNVLYTAPFVNRKNTIGLFLNPILSSGHEIGISTQNNKLVYFRYDPARIITDLSISTGIFYRRSFFAKHTFGINLSSVTIADTVINRKPDYLPFRLNNLSYINPFYQLRIDKRDAITYPLNGFLVDFSISYTIPFINTLKPFPKVGIEANYFQPLPFHFNLAFGVSSQWQPSRTYSYYFIQHLGFEDYVRGYEHFVTDASAYFVCKTELRNCILNKKFHLNFLPFKQFRDAPLQVYLKLFYDVGNSQYDYLNSGNDLSNCWLQGYGAGLDFVSFYDKSMRLEYGINQLGQSELFLHFDEAF